MRRRLIVLLALVAAVVAGVASASAITAQVDPDTAVSPPNIQPDGTGARVPVTATDPDGRPAFAIRVYRSKSGLICPEAGRTAGGRFGQLDPAGEVEATEVAATGVCQDLSKEPAGYVVNHYPARGKLPARAVVFGVTTDAVTGVTLTTAGVQRPVRFAGNTYISVVREDALAGASLDVTLADGTTKSYALQPSVAPLIAPAPEETTTG
ncbi:hypothetical protein [Baekduia sp. Peel2402]|uniref:hypothetical protein n=1 Tax=Baekduia sp. Peel2402 TaxID=3458296 RepID=UPI00403E435E